MLSLFQTLVPFRSSHYEAEAKQTLYQTYTNVMHREISYIVDTSAYFVDIADWKLVGACSVLQAKRRVRETTCAFNEATRLREERRKGLFGGGRYR